MKRAAFAVVLGIVVAGTAAGAHHSFAAFYFEDQSVTLEGQVVRYEFRNPHTWLHFTVRDEEGIERTYAAEWSNPNRLRAQGVTQDTLRPGDIVVVTGSPGRNASEYTLHLKQISRAADGWSWSGNNRGDRRRGRR